MTDQEQPQQFNFKAETQQLLQILIHSLYAERDVFLRELLSNASDALTRVKFSMLTEKDVLDADVELKVNIKIDKDAKTITLADTGVGMTRDEIVENLGTIAHSGVKQFMNAVKESNTNLADIIGQFGVGFYSAFMVADHIDVVSRSYQADSTAVLWRSDGKDAYELLEAEKKTRGTEITLHLNENAEEFLDEYRIRSIIKKHSDFVPFPIYLNDETEPVNRQTALWRQTPMSIEDKEYNDFYRQYTLDFEEPLAKLHVTVDAPVQLYALLYIPTRPDRAMFSPRQQEGLELYARKVLIQEYNTDLLPRAFRFVQGVVDSEDIPLNVSRETIQSTRVMRQIQKVLSGRVISLLEQMAEKEPEKFDKFWKTYGVFLKEGVATEEEPNEALQSLLSYRSLHYPEAWISLKQYVAEMPEGQEKIYYLLGEDEHSIKNSPHLELIESEGHDVLFMTDQVDPFVLLRLQEFKGKALANIANEGRQAETNEKDQEKPDETQPQDENNVIQRFKNILGDKVSDVRATDRLSRSPSRLVDAEGGMAQELQRVYEMLDREYEKSGKILELNLQHSLLQKLGSIDENDPRNSLIIEQIYEDALLQEGLHPDPVSMIERIQRIMETSLE